MSEARDDIAIDMERRQLLAHIAHLYYNEGLSQQEISRTVKYSRSGISRMLAEARELGIVEIRVHHPLMRNIRSEEALKWRFPELRRISVYRTDTLDYTQTLRHLATQAAEYVTDLVGPGKTVGVSWGTAVYEVVNALRPSSYYPDLTVVQLIGALNSVNPKIDGPDLARRFAQMYGGQYQILPAPLLVDSERMRDTLMAERPLRQVLELARTAELAVVGIGTVDPEMSSMVRAGFLSEEELLQIAAAGAVGDVCGIHFDVAGAILDIPINRRVMGIGSERLRTIPNVVAVASGAAKVKSIVGALRAGLINTLFTDEVTVQGILSLLSAEEGRGRKVSSAGS